MVASSRLPYGSAAFVAVGQRPSNRRALAAKYSSIDAVEVEVVLREVRERRGGEPDAVDAVQVERVRGDLHRARAVARVEHAAERALQVDRLGRRPLDRFGRAAHDLLDRPEQSAADCRRPRGSRASRTPWWSCRSCRSRPPPAACGSARRRTGRRAGPSRCARRARRPAARRRLERPLAHHRDGPGCDRGRGVLVAVDRRSRARRRTARRARRDASRRRGRRSPRRPARPRPRAPRGHRTGGRAAPAECRSSGSPQAQCGGTRLK